jgi:hypothetical protein
MIMKKIKFLLGAIALTAGTGLLSSCFSDPNVGIPPEMTTRVDDSYTVTVNINVAAQLTYNGAAVSQTFSPTGDGTLTVSANGYVTQTIPVHLGAARIITLDVTLIKTPTSDVKVADANASSSDITVGNSAENVSQMGQASIFIPGNATTSGVDGGSSYGIGIYNATGTATADPFEGQNVNADVMVAVCEPSGATFDSPVTITVSAPNAAGMDFACHNGNEAVAANVQSNSVSAEVSHFSEWRFVLNARVLSISTSQETLFDASILAEAGNNQVRYMAYTGVSSSISGVAETFLLSQFGAKARRVEKVGNLNAAAKGSAHVRITQEKKIITYQSGSVTFTATIYGGITMELVGATYDTTGHSGGRGGN